MTFARAACAGVRVRELGSCENLPSDGTPLLSLHDFTCAGGPDGGGDSAAGGLRGFSRVLGGS